MRTRSALWEQLAVRGDFRLETVAVINNVEYSTITAPVITHGLLPDKTLSVGNCIAGTLKFTVMTTNKIPKSAEVVIKARLTDGMQYSEWLEFGHFWIDRRVGNEDLIDLECFDAMLKGNQPYSDNSQSLEWPKPMQTVVTRIAQQMGVELDSRNVIKTGADYVVPIPDDSMTILDMLGYIGAVHGGNWTITPENKLRLVPLVSPVDESFNIIDESYNVIKTEEGYRLVWQYGGREEGIVNPIGAGLINVPVVLGEITNARTYTVSRVTMIKDSETVYTAGNDTGYELLIKDNPYVTQGLCDALLESVNGIEYAPFTMTQAVYDPATELGDWVVAGDRVRSVLYVETQKFDLTYQVDASAPGEDELESEYSYVSYQKKTKYVLDALKKADEQARTSIKQTNEAITLEASRASEAEGALSARITTNATNIDLKVSKENVIAEINLSTETSGGSTLKISADKVNLSGYATFTALKTAGATVINGGNVTTGYLSADRIQGGSLTLGGLNNKNGVLLIQNSSGETIGTWDNSGISITSGSININNGAFKVDSNGNLSAVGAFKSSNATGDNVIRIIDGEIRGGNGTKIQMISGLDYSAAFTVNTGEIDMFVNSIYVAKRADSTVYKASTKWIYYVDSNGQNRSFMVVNGLIVD